MSTLLWLGASTLASITAAVTTVSAVATMGLALASLLDTRNRISKAEEDPAEALRRRIQRVNRAFIDAVTLKDDLERELQRQQTELEDLSNRSEEHRVILSQDPERAETLRRVLTRKTKQEIRAERRQQLLYIGIGAIISFPIGLLVNWMS